MSKSKKKKKKASQPNANKNSQPNTARASVNTLGIDIEPEEIPAFTGEFQPEDPGLEPVEFDAGGVIDDSDLPAADDGGEMMPLTIVDKVISYATLALSMLLLGGSLVFWWIICRHLFRNPAALVDSDQMRAILLCCGILPAVVAVAQSLLRRPLNIERWLINMCISGALAALLVIIYQLGIRGEEFTFADFPTLICCTVSGSTLPAALCTLLRRAFPVIFDYFRRNSSTSGAEDWEDICEDISSLTDIEL